MNLKKTVCFFVLLALLFISTAFPQSSQQNKPVVGIAGFTTEKNEGILHEIDATICDVLKFTLTFTGSYNVKRLTVPYHSDNIKALRRICEQQQLDNIIIGSTTSNENRKVNISIEVYDRKEDRITSTENIKLSNLMDLLEVSHSLTTKVIEGFSGVHIEYGDISIQYFGDAGQIELYVDSNFIGTDVKKISNMVSGRHTFTLRNKKSTSNNQELLKKTVEIKPSITNELHFFLPLIDPVTAGELTHLDFMIATDWYENKEINFKQTRFNKKYLFEKAFKIIRNSKYPESDKLLRKYEQWKYVADSYKNIYPPKLNLSAAISESIDTHLITYFQRIPQTEIFVGIEKSLKDINFNILPYADISIDGNVDDWKNIKAFTTDPIEKDRYKITGTDFTALYLAMDEKYLYVRYDLADGPPRIENENWYKIFCKNPENDKRITLNIEKKGSQFVAQIIKNDTSVSIVLINHPNENIVNMKHNHIEARFYIEDIKKYLYSKDYSSTALFQIYSLTTGSKNKLFEYDNTPNKNFLLY